MVRSITDCEAKVFYNALKEIIALRNCILVELPKLRVEDTPLHFGANMAIEEDVLDKARTVGFA